MGDISVNLNSFDETEVNMMSVNDDGMLNIVFASNNDYVPLLGVAITSLIKNNQDDFDKINIFD